MATFNGKSFTQLTNLNVIDELRVDGVLITDPNVRIVTSSEDLSGDLSSTILYLISGIVDMTGVSVEIPQGGLNLRGHDFDLSKLVCSDDNYTMFTSPAGGSGNVLGIDYAIEVTGANSQVYDIVSDTGNEAFEFSRVNYNNCTSLGTIDNYRQGLEFGTGRFGGTPTLTLKGVWSGGYRITTSIVRNLDDAMNAPLFEAGTGFTMASRFLTDMNVDLGATASIADFTDSNFPNPSTLQIHGAIVTRNGITNADDSTIMPNISAADLPSTWQDNQGLNNTFVGGRTEVTVEIETTISTLGVFVDLAGTWTASELEHFDSPSNGQVRHIGNNPREFTVYGDLAIDGSANDELEVQLVRWDDSASSFDVVGSQVRQVNSFAGSRDVAFFNAQANVKLDQNDYIKLQVANNGGTDNVTAELASYFIIDER